MSLDARAITTLLHHSPQKGGEPRPASLSDLLNSAHASRRGEVAEFKLREASLFATAAIEMYERAIHSLLVSLYVQDTSPLWASVAGYYSSHYVARALCHLHGRYLLYRKGLTADVKSVSKKVAVRFQTTKYRKEHDFYWRAASEVDSTGWWKPNINEEQHHRHFANYQDHIGCFTEIRPFEPKSFDGQLVSVESAVTERLAGRVNELVNTTPRAQIRYADFVTVQCLARRRIAAFRDHLDGLVGVSTNYWASHRAPEWCSRVMSYDHKEPLEDLVGR